MKPVSLFEKQVQQRPLPRHVGIIMDGNGRWAQARGLPRLQGHKEGSNSVREVTRCARRIGVEALTLYAFSSQNWARPPTEVAGLMELLRDYLIKERSEIMENEIRLNAIGDLSKLPGLVREPLDALCDESRHNRRMVLTLALSYGGREEILSAIQEMARRVAEGSLKPEKITEETVDDCLWTHDLPPVDLIVRTSGEHRVSNFLLWQSAYAEFIFSDVLWPEFRSEELLECISQYQNRERRFGLTSGQLKAVGT